MIPRSTVVVIVRLGFNFLLARMCRHVTVISCSLRFYPVLSLSLTPYKYLTCGLHDMTDGTWNKLSLTPRYCVGLFTTRLCLAINTLSAVLLPFLYT